MNAGKITARSEEVWLDIVPIMHSSRIVCGLKRIERDNWVTNTTQRPYNANAASLDPWKSKDCPMLHIFRNVATTSCNLEKSYMLSSPWDGDRAAIARKTPHQCHQNDSVVCPLYIPKLQIRIVPSADQRTGFVVRCTVHTKAICLMKSHCAVLLWRASGSFLSSYEY